MNFSVILFFEDFIPFLPFPRRFVLNCLQINILGRALSGVREMTVVANTRMNGGGGFPPAEKNERKILVCERGEFQFTRKHGET